MACTQAPMACGRLQDAVIRVGLGAPESRFKTKFYVQGLRGSGLGPDFQRDRGKAFGRCIGDRLFQQSIRNTLTATVLRDTDIAYKGSLSSRIVAIDRYQSNQIRGFGDFKSFSFVVQALGVSLNLNPAGQGRIKIPITGLQEPCKGVG